MSFKKLFIQSKNVIKIKSGENQIKSLFIHKKSFKTGGIKNHHN